MRTIKEWQEEVTKCAVDHGFVWGISNINTALLRLHSEVSEASEALRDDDMEGFAEELADIFIRLANICEVINIDLESEVVKKHDKNIGRPILHGRKNK